MEWLDKVYCLRFYCIFEVMRHPEYEEALQDELHWGSPGTW